MRTIAATRLRENLYRTMQRVNDDSEPLLVTSAKGKGVVLLGEDDWAAIEETLYLSSIPGFVDSVRDAAAEPIEEAVHPEELDW